MGIGARQPGCFRYGCFIATILVVVVFGSLTWWSIRSVRQAFEFYTSDTPSVLTGIRPISESALDQGKAKWERLVDAFNANTGVKVQFSSDEFMGALHGLGFSNNVEVVFDGAAMRARFCAPLSLFGQWTAAQKLVGNVGGRFLTGEFVGKISITDNEPKIECEKFVLNHSVLEEMARGHAASWLEGAVRSVAQSSRGGARIANVAISESLLDISLVEERRGNDN